MADKLKQGVNVLTTFVEGETPSAAKLNSITAQLRNASQQLEKAVGDIHNQSYPYSSDHPDNLSIAYGRAAEATGLSPDTTRPLDIANLARLIGPASALNPMVLEGTLQVTEDVPSGVYEFCLNYPPESTTSVTFTDNGVGSTFENQITLNPANIAAPGDYYIDDLGRVFTTRETSATPNTVTYTVDRSSWNGGSQYLGSRFNVIPGPNQLAAGGNGCSIGGADPSDGSREIVTPTLTSAQFNETLDSTALSDQDPNYQEQLALPLVITAVYSAGETIPEGFIYLKNWTTGEVYDTATYSYVSSTAVKIGGVDITVEVDRGDVFALITVGTDVTTSIDDLRRKMRHGHDRAYGEPLVPASAITNFTAGPWSSQGSFTKSTISGNVAPQYLHRYGYNALETEYNDANVMRGDLVLGKSSALAGSYVSDPTDASILIDTNKLAFGHPNRNYIYERATGPQALVFHTEKSSLEMTAPEGGYTLTVEDDIDITSNAGGIDIVAGDGDLHITANGGPANELKLESFETAMYLRAQGTLANGGKPFYIQNLSNVSGTGSEIEGKILVHARNFGFGQYSSVSEPVVTDFKYQTGSFNADERIFSVQMDNTVSGGTECPAVFSNDSSGYGVLELNAHGTSGGAFRFLNFTDGTSSTGSSVGSVRGASASGVNVFISDNGTSAQVAERVVGTSAAVETINSAQVRFISGSADYGEWLLAGDPTEWTDYRSYNSEVTDRMGLPEGLIVYVREGTFWRNGPGTPMAVTNRAIVVGNMQDGLWEATDCEVLSFIGQVPVATLGPVKSGDYLVPHPEKPNFVIGVDAELCTFSQYCSAIGTAWESSEEPELKLVLCAIGKK